MGYRELSNEDVHEMKRLEGAFVRWIKPWQVSHSPLLVAIILVRCARTVLRLANPNDQKEILPILVAFLEGKVSPPTPASELLWTPDQGAPPRPM